MLYDLNFNDETKQKIKKTTKKPALKIDASVANAQTEWDTNRTKICNSRANLFLNKTSYDRFYRVDRQTVYQSEIQVSYLQDMLTWCNRLDDASCANFQPGAS